MISPDLKRSEEKRIANQLRCVACFVSSNFNCTFQTESELQHRSGAMLLNKTSTKSCRVVSCIGVGPTLRCCWNRELWAIATHSRFCIGFFTDSPAWLKTALAERMRKHWEVCQSDWYKRRLHKEQTVTPDWVIDIMHVFSLIAGHDKNMQKPWTCPGSHFLPTLVL